MFNLKIKFLVLFVCVTAFLSVGQLLACPICENAVRCENYTNEKDIRGEVVACFATDSIHNTGSIVADQFIYAAAGEKITGNGTLQAPVIIIIAKDFEYTGIISASEKCYILTSKPISPNFQGPGKLDVKTESDPKVWEEIKKEIAEGIIVH